MSGALLCISSKRWQSQCPNSPPAPKRAGLHFPQVWALEWQERTGDKAGRGSDDWGSPTYCDHVLAQEASDLPRSVVDGEFRSILHVTGGFRGVVETVNLW